MTRGTKFSLTEAIRRRADEIRQSWSPDERKFRRGLPPDAFASGSLPAYFAVARVAAPKGRRAY